VTVGVVLPVHDGAEYVAAAIDSVLAQTHEDLALVVVDDGSTDATPDIVRGYDDPRVTLLRNDENLGVATSRNRGVDAVAGEHIAFIDHDDVWHPEKLERHLARHRAADAAVVYSDLRTVRPDGQPLGTTTKPEPRAAGAPLVRQLFFQGGGVITTMSSVTVTRAAWTAVGGEDPAYTVSGDIDLYVRLAGEHTFARVPAPLVDRRRHDANISGDHRQVYRDHERLVDRATARYDFLDADDVRRKRARMAYRRATSALAAGDGLDALRAARESLGYDRRGRPALVALLAGLDVGTGPLALGQRLYLTYDRLVGA
jgi:glycosyltransferase involved in cell wall biosynthesis